MWIIEQKSNEIEQIQKEAGNRTNFDSRITELKGENLELKDIICKSKLDIKTLEKNVEEKNRTIDGNIAQFDQLKEHMNDIKTENVNQTKKLEKDIREKENVISEMRGIVDKNKS